MLQKTLGSRLAALRKQHGMNQDELAKKMHIQRVKVTQIETEKRQPNLEELSEIANIFDVTVDFLLCRTPVPKPDIEMQAVCNITGLDLESIGKLQQILIPMYRINKNGVSAGEALYTFGNVVNAIIHSEYFDEIVSILYQISKIHEDEGFEYNELTGKVANARLDPENDRFRISGGTRFALRDIYTMRYEKAVKYLYDDVTKEADALRDADSRIVGFNMTESGPEDLSPKSTMKIPGKPSK